jgi:hypothetical protein
MASLRTVEPMPQGSEKCLSCGRRRCFGRWCDAIARAGDHSGIRECLAQVASALSPRPRPHRKLQKGERLWGGTSAD